MKRDISIDILRGFAILTMVAANLSAYVLQMPPPLLFRFYGTFAAPIFILLSGGMVGLKGKDLDRGFIYYLRRGSLILLVAGLIELIIWHEIPFMTVDVLYLIGLAMPITYLFSHLKDRLKTFIILTIFVLSPVLQSLLGYRESINVIVSLGAINRWLIDGWFPIFPWMGFCFLGPVILQLRQNSETKFGNLMAFWSGLLFFCGGAALWFFYPGALLIREGYSEMFYPPTLGYIATAIGIIILLFALIDRWAGIFIFRPMQWLGEASLFFYILHLCAIKYYFSVYWAGKDFDNFTLIYLAFIFGLILIAFGLRQIKNQWINRPKIVKFFIG
ncbi:MAG: heparan-alpha-glucosaminide N-acetyltransferase domain-containing protein [Candidatus Margulisiibacteriota bacterium]